MVRKTTRQKRFANKSAPVPNVPVAAYIMQVGAAVWPTGRKQWAGFTSHLKERSFGDVFADLTRSLAGR